MMHEHVIAYQLTDEQEARLMALTVRYNRILHADDNQAVSADDMLSILVLPGSGLQVDERMAGIVAALDAAERRNTP
jgi:hypothetical protein